MSVIRLVTIGLLIGFSLPCAAQETGSLITHPLANIDGSTAADARRTMRQFGICSVSREPGTAEHFLAAPVNGPEFNRLMSDVATSECLGNGQLTIPRSIMRGSLYEALYNRRFHRTGPVQFNDVAAIDYRAGYAPGDVGRASSTIAMGELGDCVVRADGLDAKNLILSIPVTSQEDEAIMGLSAHLGPCVTKGQQIRFSRSIIRAAVAEALYRLSDAATKRT